MALPSPLTARFEGSEDIVQGEATVLQCPIYDGGALVPPSSGTVTIYDASRTAVVNAQAVVITGDVATYTLTSSADAEAGWQVVWDLVIAGDARRFINEGALVLQRLYPVLTDGDLYRRVPNLDPSASDTVWSSDTTTLEAWRDDAWTEIKDRLTEMGVRHSLVLTPTSFRRVHRALTLALVFEYLANTLSDQHREDAKQYRAEFNSAWVDLRFIQDADEDGDPDSIERESAEPTQWLM